MRPDYRKQLHAANYNGPWFIYSLIDPRNSAVRYVGFAIDPCHRFKAHLNSARKNKTHKDRWILSLSRDNLIPELRMLATGYGAGWAEAERAWIAHYRASGERLINKTDGGEGTPGCSPNEETRSRMSRAQTGRKMSDRAIAKTRAALLGRKQSKDHIAKLSLARKGKLPTKAIAAAAIANRGKKLSPELIARRSETRIGVARESQRKPKKAIAGIDHWQCATCKEWKPTMAFVACRSSWNGIKQKCKECHQQYQSNRRVRRIRESETIRQPMLLFC